jgi:hypothetical protein
MLKMNLKEKKKVKLKYNLIDQKLKLYLKMDIEKLIRIKLQKIK